MKIKAAVLREIGRPPPYEQSQPLTLEEVELDAPGPGEVLVRIRAAGLCHSDLSVIDGNRPRPLPMVLGHEAAGVVEQVGEGVTSLARGAPCRVTVSTAPSPRRIHGQIAGASSFFACARRCVPFAS